MAQRLTSTILNAGLGFLLSSTAFADYAVDWFNVSSGGGTSRGGDFSLSGTVGQSAIGPMSAGDYHLQVGFWGLPVKVPARTPPTLSVTTTATNAVILSWTSSARFVLEENVDLQPANWISVGILPVQLGSLWKVTIPASAEHRFYRLRLP